MSRKMSIQDANMDVMREINQLLDSLLSSSSLYDVELQKHCMKFQVEHATAKAAFQQRRSVAAAQFAEDSATTSPEVEHLLCALIRMIDLGFGVSSHILKCTSACYQGTSPVSGSSFTSVSDADGDRSPVLSSQEHDGFNGMRASSVEDVSGESWIECGANLMHSATQLLALTLVVHSELRPRLQQYFVDDLKLLRLVFDALSIPKEHEITYFAVGFKTDFMRLLANLTFDNTYCCEALSEMEVLFSEVLRATKIDDENPHMVEWAEFALRNLLSSSSKARDQLSKLKALELDATTKQFLNNGGVEPVLDVQTQKVTIFKTE